MIANCSTYLYLAMSESYCIFVRSSSVLRRKAARFTARTRTDTWEEELDMVYASATVSSKRM